MSNTPNIRFKGFTDPWEQCKFGDIGSISMCKRIFKEETSDDGDIPFYKIGTFGGKPDAYISRELFEEYKAKFSFPEKGDILLSASGTIGRIVEYGGEEAYFQDSNIVWLSHDKSVSNKFLKVLYPTVRWDGIEGSTIQRLYNDNFLKTKFMMPQIEEQEKLGEYFGQLDYLITLHQRKCDEMSELKKYMLQKMFPQKGEQFPEIRFSGFTAPWEQCKVGDIAGRTYGGGTPKTRVEEYWDGAIPWIQSSNLLEHELFNVDIQRHITELGLQKSAAQLIPKNSIAVVSHVGVGKLAFMPFDYTTSQDFISLSELKTEPIFSCYILYKRLQDDLHVVQGSAIKGITKEDLLGKVITVPSGLEQSKIGATMQNLDNLITLHQHKCDELKAVKKFMLQNMFPTKG